MDTLPISLEKKVLFVYFIFYSFVINVSLWEAASRM